MELRWHIKRLPPPAGHWSLFGFPVPDPSMFHHPTAMAVSVRVQAHHNGHIHFPQGQGTSLRRHCLLRGMLLALSPRCPAQSQTRPGTVLRRQVNDHPQRHVDAFGYCECALPYETTPRTSPLVVHIKSRVLAVLEAPRSDLHTNRKRDDGLTHKSRKICELSIVTWQACKEHADRWSNFSISTSCPRSDAVLVWGKGLRALRMQASIWRRESSSFSGLLRVPRQVRD